MHESLAASAARHLTAKGVTLRLNTSLVSASSGEALLSDGGRIQTRTIIVTVGVGPNPVVASLPVQKDRGRVKTD
jgi:NADH dehydrogenase